MRPAASVMARDSSDEDEEAKRCLNCGASFDGLKRCPKCKKVYFCNAACQREVWKEHCKTCVAPAGSASAAPPPPTAGPGAAQPGAGHPGAAPPVPPKQLSPEEVKQNELRRIRTEVLPEVAALMAERDFEKAIEWLEDAVAFASGYDERELLDSMSCLLARCFLSLGKPKEALGGLNPALMHARRTGGPTAVKPHSVAAECFIAMGDKEKVRVELRALMEAAAESEDEREQCGALLFAGCVLFDLGDLPQAVAVLASATTAAEKTKDHGARATASHRAGAALLRLRKPAQAIDAWTKELRALEDGSKAEAEEAAQALASETDSLEMREGEAETKTKPSAKSDEGASPPPTFARRPIGDARRRRCRAHGNLFTAHLLTGARDAAEMHLSHALTVAKELSAEDEARVWLQAANARRLAGDASDGVSEEAKEAYERAAALAREAKAETIVAAAERGMRGEADVSEMLGSS